VAFLSTRIKKKMRSVRSDPSRSDPANEPRLSDYLRPSDKDPMAEGEKRLSRDIKKSLTTNELAPLAQALGLQGDADQDS